MQTELLRAVVSLAGLALAACSRELPPEARPPSTTKVAPVVSVPRTSADASVVQASSKNEGVAVVELFTSEGCSSCPAADRVLSKLTANARAQGRAIFTLSFHVDYWNYLGWRDRFSSSQYSARQHEYSGIAHGSTYTPQVVVNGESESVGSDRPRIEALIDAALARAPRTEISIEALRQRHEVGIRYRATGATQGRLLNFALLQPNAESEVATGENAGERLAHVNVVRAFVSRPLSQGDSGSLTLPVATELEDHPLELVAYSEDRSQRDISGATALALP